MGHRRANAALFLILTEAPTLDLSHPISHEQYGGKGGGESFQEILAKNFGVPQSAFRNLPAPSQRYIYPGVVPGSALVMQVSDPYGPSPQSFTYQMLAQPAIQNSKGSIRIVDSSNFHSSKTIAAVLQDIEPGGMREALPKKRPFIV